MNAKASNQQPIHLGGRSSRRSFFVFSGQAVGALLLSSLYRPALALGAWAESPGTVTIAQFDQAGKPTGKTVVPKIVKTDADWKKALSPISYNVTRQAGTERAYTGDSWNLHDTGLFRCICCNTALFSSSTKFDSGTGWPSFWQPIAKENVVETKDDSLGFSRVAVSCRQCDAHLGHVFDDGPRPTGLRYCMNSAAMKFYKLG